MRKKNTSSIDLPVQDLKHSKILIAKVTVDQLLFFMSMFFAGWFFGKIVCLWYLLLIIYCFIDVFYVFGAQNIYIYFQMAHDIIFELGVEEIEIKFIFLSFDLIYLFLVCFGKGEFVLINRIVKWD